MSSIASPYKVHVKLGQAEFQAEGPEETVKERLAHFYIAATTAPFAPPGNGNGNANGKNGNGAAHMNGNGAEPAALQDVAPDLELRTSVDQKTISRLFREEHGII